MMLMTLSPHKPKRTKFLPKKSTSISRITCNMLLRYRKVYRRNGGESSPSSSRLRLHPPLRARKKKRKEKKKVEGHTRKKGACPCPVATRRHDFKHGVGPSLHLPVFLGHVQILSNLTSLVRGNLNKEIPHFAERRSFKCFLFFALVIIDRNIDFHVTF
jgi:hypothetical protein